MITIDQQGPARFIQMDDGKANVLTTKSLVALRAALAEAADNIEVKVIVLSGRTGFLTAGLDLKALQAGGSVTEALRQETGHFLCELAGFLKPVVVIATGHAIAAGAMILMAADWRIGLRGEYRIGMNEVRDGIPLPALPLLLARFRLGPGHLTRATTLAEIYNPDTAIEAGYLDECLIPGGLSAAIAPTIERMAALDVDSFAKTKAAIRADLLRAMRSSLNG